MNAELVFRRLKDTRPFVYHVGGKYYVIGAANFRQCEPIEIKLHCIYMEQMMKLKNKECKFDLETKDCKILNSVLDELIKVDNKKIDNVSIAEAKECLWKLIEDCSIEDLNNLTMQIDLFIKALDYRDSAFYRHSKKCT